ncbi:sugar kinase [Streptomyces parvus]|uniref:Sugar kinase n=1 Tax=Streptomyces parvus TaxID=66428 RepID=A0A7K3RYL2_9ACTN|nr:sugar kinase [Streptomyces parvus]NEC20307.1 sugar kinase [Streptomyces parvus]
MSGVLTIGEAMASVRTRALLRLGGAAQLSVAGSESNVAIGLARLGHEVSWVGVVGEDQPGELIRRTLRAEGVGTGFVRSAQDAFTGFIAFDQPTHDITRVSYHRAGSAGSTLTAAECVAALTAASPELLHLTGITPALSATAREATVAAARAAHGAGVRVALDVNHRARLWSRADAAATLRELLPWVHTVFASEDELDLLSPAEHPAPDLLARGVAEVVVTAGANGARCHTPEGSLYRPALPVTVVDSIGAGDAFVSGYLSGVLDGLSPDLRLGRAAAAGAFCVGAHGDWEALPRREDLTLLSYGEGLALR